MSEIKELFSLLSGAEKESFIRYLKEKNRRHDTRNIAFVNELLHQKESKIKSKIGSNAYNALKKRVNDRLIEFLATISFEKDASEEIIVMKQLMIANKLLQNQFFKKGFKLLEKAEIHAQSLQHYTLLNEVYHTAIEYSYHPLSQNQEDLIQKLEANNRLFLEQERLNSVFAIIKKAFNAYEFNGKPFDLESLLKKSYEKYGVTEEGGYNYKTLSQLAQIADIYGAYKKDYTSVDLFFEDQLNNLENQSFVVERHIPYHIEVLYYVANIYFRKKNFIQSLNYLKRMKVQMDKDEKRYSEKYYVKYKNLKCLNLNYSGEKLLAIEELEKLIQNKKYEYVELLNPQLALLMIYFQNGDYSKVKKNLAKLNRSDLWYERIMGIDWILNKKYFEIIFHLELGNTDLVDSRISNLVRTHGKFLKSQGNSQALPFLKLLQKVHTQPQLISSPEFRKLVKSIIQWRKDGQEDIFMISFYAWLKSKMEGKDLYEMTLELVRFG